MEKLIKFLVNRMVIVGILILLQIIVLVVGIFVLSSKMIYMNSCLSLISIIVVLFIINKGENPSYKLAWIIPILTFPVFGGLFYLLFGGHRVGNHIKSKNQRVMKETAHLLQQDPEILREIHNINSSAYNQINYLVTPHKSINPEDTILSSYPIYKNTETKYISPGEDFFECLLDELEKAQKFIFMEYFIIEEGYMWNSILDILALKAAQGVDVRLIYDDIGCIMKLPPNYVKFLKKKGIQCRVFNPFRAHVFKVSLMNNRDHRKITVIDGHTGFTGGINLADEYMNVTHPFGYWKDAAVMLRGEAVWNLTVMFMQMWNVCGTYEDFNYRRYTPYIYSPIPFKSDGYVLPYSDSPMDSEIQAEMVYLNMITRAKHYIYISSPYLVIDNELSTSLMLAAKSGVDVRIVTPHKYDKWYVHLCSQANYMDLVKSGVKIYEYAPGFIHSKTFVCDDELATVGTVNLDYRSLYLHFECGVLMYKSAAVLQLKDDYLKMLKDCILMTEAKCNEVNIFKRILRGLLKVFAPLL